VDQGSEGQAGIPPQRPRRGKSIPPGAERAFHPPHASHGHASARGMCRAPADTMPGSCLHPARTTASFRGGQGSSEAHHHPELGSRLSARDLPVASLPAPAGKPPSKAPCNPAEVLLPIHALQELCLSAESLKPSPNHLISLSTSSLCAGTFPLTCSICRLPDNSLASLSARVF